MVASANCVFELPFFVVAIFKLPIEATVAESDLIFDICAILRTVPSGILEFEVVMELTTEGVTGESGFV